MGAVSNTAGRGRGLLPVAIWALPALVGRLLFDKKYRVGSVDFGQSFGWSADFRGAPLTFGSPLTYNLSES